LKRGYSREQAKIFRCQKCNTQWMKEIPPDGNA
jgi:ribosomal protein L37AE/L43A